MKTDAFKIYLFAIIVMCAGIYLFIKLNNDHKECNALAKYSTAANGSKIVTKTHICNEKYNF